MVFSDSSTNLGLVQDVLFRTNTDVNQYPLKDITRYINEAYSRVASIIIKSDGKMQWDDANHTNQPIATFDLVANQTSYELFVAAPTALQDWLELERLEVKTTSAGNDWVKLIQGDKRTLGTAITDYQETAGIPSEFDLSGTTVYLYPPSSYWSTGGGKAFFTRAPSYFASTDTTKAPGFATIFHTYLSMYAAHQWNGIKKGDYSLQQILNKMENEIAQFYMKRNQSDVPMVRRSYQSYQ